MLEYLFIYLLNVIINKLNIVIDVWDVLVDKIGMYIGFLECKINKERKKIKKR